MPPAALPIAANQTEEAMPLVSIFLVTYNHERYISEAIGGILRQTAAADTELVWHDDASTDATVEAGERALAGSGMRVKRLHRRLNRHSRGIPFALDMYELAEGDFIAWHEGDDLWLEDHKIASQLDALREWAGADICFTRAASIDANGTRLPNLVSDYGESAGLASVETVISGDGGFMPTSSIMLRKDFVSRIPGWVFGFQPISDYLAQVYGSLRGGATYLPLVSTGYRTGHPGAWTVQTHQDPIRLLEHHCHVLTLITRMKAELPQHANAFEPVIRNHLGNLMAVSLRIGELKYVSRAISILQ
jgi:glycosyltransferase involved in cell wall biosynthesis